MTGVVAGLRSVASWLPIAAVCLAAFGAAPAGATSPAPHERLVYISDDGPFATNAGWTMNVRGGARRRISGASLLGARATLAASPSGTLVAIVDRIPGLDALPSAARARYSGRVGSTVTFADFKSLEDWGGFILYANGRGAPTAFGRASWSPDGRRLVIATGTPQHLGLAVFRYGRGTEPLVSVPEGDCLNPSWSPDGRSIVFQVVNGATSQLFIVKSDGSQLRRLSDGRGYDSFPDWSPDGRTIVFASTRNGQTQIYVAPANGGSVSQVTHDPGSSSHPAWSPDGRWIGYSNDRDEEDDLFLIDPSGTHERRLTHTPADEIFQGWQALRDIRKPYLKALPSSTAVGKAPVLRYLAADNSGVLALGVDVKTRTGDFDSAEIAPLRGAHDLRVRTYRVPRQLLLSDGDIKPAQLLRFRFCLTASDPWGNSVRSCGWFHVSAS